LEERTYAEFRKGLAPVAGIREAVESIQQAGHPTCVASNGNHQKMLLTLGLTDLLPLFGERLFSATQVPRGKPAPDLFLFAAKQMNASPKEVTVIEDSLPGVQGALEAGTRVLAYVSPERPVTSAHQEELRRLGVSTFSSMGALPALLSR
jgi:HAD superfamily hydrolase (TIGR01509 family)